MTTSAASLPGGQEPISFTVTLPFSLHGWSFFVAILSAAALIAAAAWAAHLWATREGRIRAFLARMDRLGLARREGDQPPKLHKFTWVLLPFVPVIAALVALAIGGAFSLLLVAIRGAPSIASGEGTGLTSSAAAAGVLVVAILGAPFVIWRAIVAQKTVNVAEQGMITDRINKAVEGLGAEKTVKQVIETPRYRKDDDGGWLRDDAGRLIVDKGPDGADLVDRETVERTRPNLEVRIGAIYALERIAQDSLRDHIQIMEILCAYIRENAPASQVPKLPVPPEFDIDDINGSRVALAVWNTEHDRALATAGAHGGPVRPRQDVQVALTVIGRRSARQRERESGGALAFEDAVGAYPSYSVGGDAKADDKWEEDRDIWAKKQLAWLKAARPYRLDLRRSDLAGANLSGGHFDHGNFTESRLDGANLNKAGLNGAYLTGAGLSSANLNRAGINGADLSGARLNGAHLYRAGLNGAYLQGARLGGAYLREAGLNGANLYRAELNGADLCGAGINGANLEKARLNGSFLYEAGLNDAILAEAELNGAGLQEAGLNGADLADAELNSANLAGAVLNGAYLSGVDFDRSTSFANVDASKAATKNVDLSEVTLSTEQIVVMFGDASVTLPGGVTPGHPDWPPHWPKEVLDWKDFHERWEAWKAEGRAREGS